MFMLYALASAAAFYLVAWTADSQAARNEIPFTRTGRLSIPFLAIWAAIPTAGSAWRIRRQRRQPPGHTAR
jgi:hypothetical protein